MTKGTPLPLMDLCDGGRPASALCGQPSHHAVEQVGEFFHVFWWPLKLVVHTTEHHQVELW